MAHIAAERGAGQRACGDALRLKRLGDARGPLPGGGRHGNVLGSRPVREVVAHQRNDACQFALGALESHRLAASLVGAGAGHRSRIEGLVGSQEVDRVGYHAAEMAVGQGFANGVGVGGNELFDAREMRVIFRAVRAGARLACDKERRARKKTREALGRAAGHLVVVDENVIAAEGLQVMGEALAVIEGRAGKLAGEVGLSMAQGADEQAKDALFLLVVEPIAAHGLQVGPAAVEELQHFAEAPRCNPGGFHIFQKKALLEAHEDAAPPTRAGFGLRRGQHVERVQRQCRHQGQVLKGHDRFKAPLEGAGRSGGGGEQDDFSRRHALGQKIQDGLHKPLGLAASDAPLDGVHFGCRGVGRQVHGRVLPSGLGCYQIGEQGGVLFQKALGHIGNALVKGRVGEPTGIAKEHRHPAGEVVVHEVALGVDE